MYKNILDFEHPTYRGDPFIMPLSTPIRLNREKKIMGFEYAMYGVYCLNLLMIFN